MPPLYKVQLFAAPPGERAIGVVQEQPTAKPPDPKPEKPKPLPKPTVARPVPKPTAKAVPAVKQATPTPPVKTAPPKEPRLPRRPRAVARRAGREPTSRTSTRADSSSTIRTTSTTSSTADPAWGQGAPRIDADVRFMIKRDGTVDPASIQLVTHGELPQSISARSAPSSKPPTRNYSAHCRRAFAKTFFQ